MKFDKISMIFFIYLMESRVGIYTSDAVLS